MALPKQTLRITALRQEIIQRRLTDQIFSLGTPALKTFMSRAKAVPGPDCGYWPILVSNPSGAWRTRSGPVAAIQTPSMTPAPATQATMAKYYRDWVIYLDEADIRQSAGEGAIFDYVRVQTDRMAEAVRSDVAKQIWTPHVDTENNWYSLVDAIGDSVTAASYAGIDVADLPEWTSFVMDCPHTSNTDVGVSPSLANFQKMARCMAMMNGKYPDAIYTTGAVWQRLVNELGTNAYIAADREENEITWGVRYLRLAEGDIPVLIDRHVPGKAFDGTKSTRAAAGGHYAYFVDWDYVHVCYTPGTFMQLDKWREAIVLGYYRQFAPVRLEAGIITDRRRAHGMIACMDPTIPITSYTEGTVTWAGQTVQ